MREKKPRPLGDGLFLWCLAVFVFLVGCGGGLRGIPSAGIVESGKVTLTWNAVPGASSYNVYMSTSPDVSKLSGYKIPNASTPMTITGLEPGTTYYFVVTVVKEFDESEPVAALSYTGQRDVVGRLDFGDIGTPAAPQPTAGDNGNEQITLSWDEVEGAEAYNIYWGIAPGVNKQNGNKVPDVENPHTMQGLSKGVTYHFVVTSIIDGAESKESAEISYTVPK